MKGIFRYTFAVAAVVISACSGGEKTLSQRFPGAWKTDANIEIGRALVAKKIRGCGEYKYKESADGDGEFVVYCTGPHDEQLAYIVWANIQEVEGPFPTDPKLN